MISEGNVSATFDNPEIRTYAHSGYDGQFYYAIALSPLETVAKTIKNPLKLSKLESQSHQGVRIDNPVLRAKRIGYPLTAWAISGLGKEGVLPFILVLLNILCIGLGTAACFLMAKSFNAPPVYCLGSLLFIGAWMCLYRDLADQMAMVLALFALFFLFREHLWSFSAFGIAAMLTKETVVFLLLGGVVSYGWAFFRQYRYGKSAILLAPFLVYFAWSFVLSWNDHSTGTLLKHFDWPFFGMGKGFLQSPDPILWWVAIIPVLLIALESSWHLWKHPSKIGKPTSLIFLFNFGFAIIMSCAIYEDPFSFARNVLPLQYAGLLLLLDQKKRVSWLTLFASILGVAFYLRSNILYA